MTTKKFAVHTPGLLPLLSDTLYSSPSCGLRELIQNSADACLRRQAAGVPKGYKPRITVRACSEDNTLVIKDNGAGLTVSETENFLATLGRSQTAEFREETFLRGDDAEQAIGAFGIGFLASFKLFSKITVLSRSHKAPASQGVRFECHGDDEYSIEETAARSQIGSTIVLNLKPSCSYLLNERCLADAIRHFCEFLPTEICVNGTAINRAPPWTCRDPLKAANEYIEKHWNESAIVVIPLDDITVGSSHEPLTVPVRGFLWIPAKQRAAAPVTGDITLHIRGMRICSDTRFLGKYRGLLRGIVECPRLAPTLNREGVLHDWLYEQVCEAVQNHVACALKRLLPYVFAEVFRSHPGVLDLALDDPKVFAAIKDVLPLPTSRHNSMTVPEYCRTANSNKVYFRTRAGGSVQDAFLSSDVSKPAFHAFSASVQRFLKQYASCDRRLELIQVDGHGSKHLKKVRDQRIEKLARYFRTQHRMLAEVAEFNEAIPAVLIENSAANLAIDARRALEIGLPDDMAGFAAIWAEPQGPGPGPTLYLNSRNRLIRTLVAAPNVLRRDAALDLILETARLFSGRPLRAENMRIVYEKLTTVLEE